MVDQIVALMMAPFKKVDIKQIVAETVVQHTGDIEELNRQQLAEGKTAEGQEIKPYYKPSTIRRKQKLGQPTDHVTLRDKENFYKGMKGKRISGGTEVSSNSPATPYLVAKYGDGIFGLTPASKEVLAERMKPTLQQKYLQALQS